MKLTIFGFVIALSTALNGAYADTTPISEQQLGEYKTGDYLQTIKFKNQLVIPFDLLSQKEKSKINHAQNDLDRMLTVVFVNGRIIRATDVLAQESREDSSNDYKAAFHAVDPSGVISSENWDSLDINYCKASVILSGKKNKNGYILTINKEAHPLAQGRSRMSINFGDLVETKYKLYVDLSPKERPNEATIRGFSKEIPSLSCVRHSKSGSGTRVIDFVTAIGATNVEVQ